jgi:deoxyribodipyrimidine photo-lyase
MRESVAMLAASLEEAGGSLTVVTGDPARVVPAFAATVRARRVVVSRDYAPYGVRRDARVADALAGVGIELASSPGILIREPSDVVTAEGRGFRVFSPFLRAWHQAPLRPVLPAPERIHGSSAPSGRSAIGSIERALGHVLPTASRDLLPDPGEAPARGRLDRWVASPAIDRYAVDRNRLDVDGTSRLGQDLRWGLLSPVEVAARSGGPGDGRRRYIEELAWRDFYAHLLYREPRVLREAYRPELERVAWADEPGLADAWRAGRTGYPVIDAAMRQLVATGWMHNRARMIVASFLTKHLGIDWRVGERHFMDHLLDGDLASNNGGWQWAASTGTDAQPWFRVFNPTLQGLRHDPDGDFVRRWVPELRDVSGSAVHEPPSGRYLPPIVDHREARSRALAAYRAAVARE